MNAEKGATFPPSSRLSTTTTLAYPDELSKSNIPEANYRHLTQACRNRYQGSQNVSPKRGKGERGREKARK